MAGGWAITNWNLWAMRVSKLEGEGWRARQVHPPFRPPDRYLSLPFLLIGNLSSPFFLAPPPSIPPDLNCPIRGSRAPRSKCHCPGPPPLSLSSFSSRAFCRIKIINGENGCTSITEEAQEIGCSELSHIPRSRIFSF